MTDDERVAWLETLKVGDKIALTVGFGYKDYAVFEVERATRTQVLVNGRRYSRANGLLMASDRWSKKSILPVTDEVRAVIERNRLISRVRNIDPTELPTETLRAIAALLDADACGTEATDAG